MSRETDVRVDYKLVDITAAADGVLSMPNIQPFSDFTELLDEEQAIRRWATVETNAWELDGTMEILPDGIGSVFMGVWSAAMSGDDNAFTALPVLTVTFPKRTHPAALLLCLTRQQGDWCSDLNITWYDQDGGQMASKDFAPEQRAVFLRRSGGGLLQAGHHVPQDQQTAPVSEIDWNYLRRDSGSWQRTADFLFGAGGGQPDFFRSVG